MINTFDVRVCMKTLSLVWKYPDQYSKHIFLGRSHTKMKFIGKLTKKKIGSGLVGILIEEKLVTAGTVVSVLSGKEYSKVLFNLKRHLNDYYLKSLLNLINVCSSSSCSEQLDNALQDEPVAHIANK